MPLWQNIFLNLTPAPQFSVNYCYNDFHKNPWKVLVLTDRWTDVVSISSIFTLQCSHSVYRNAANANHLTNALAMTALGRLTVQSSLKRSHTRDLFLWRHYIRLAPNFSLVVEGGSNYKELRFLPLCLASGSVFATQRCFTVLPSVCFLS
jgi:hypothetical protein